MVIRYKENGFEFDTVEEALEFKTKIEEKQFKVEDESIQESVEVVEKKVRSKRKTTKKKKSSSAKKHGKKWTPAEDLVLKAMIYEHKKEGHHISKEIKADMRSKLGRSNMAINTRIRTLGLADKTLGEKRKVGKKFKKGGIFGRKTE